MFIRLLTLPSCRSRKTSWTAIWETVAEMHRASHLIVLDWGTSSLRAECMNAQGDVLHTASTDDGILSVADRAFHRVFSRPVAAWVQAYPACLALAAGMLGSRQGWPEAPYVPCPAGFAELGGGLIWADDTQEIGSASCGEGVGQFG